MSTNLKLINQLVNSNINCIINELVPKIINTFNNKNIINVLKTNPEYVVNFYCNNLTIAITYENTYYKIRIYKHQNGVSYLKSYLKSINASKKNLNDIKYYKNSSDKYLLAENIQYIENVDKLLNTLLKNVFNLSEANLNRARNKMQSLMITEPVLPTVITSPTIENRDIIGSNSKLTMRIVLDVTSLPANTFVTGFDDNGLKYLVSYNQSTNEEIFIFQEALKYELKNQGLPQMLTKIEGPCKVTFNPIMNSLFFEIPENIDINKLRLLPNSKPIYKIKITNSGIEFYDKENNRYNANGELLI